MQCLGVLPAHIITFVIGLFCMENFVFDASGRKKLEEKLHIRFEEIAKLNVKEDLIISLKDGRTIDVPFEEVDEIARPACLACTDFANDYADLSVGGLGSPAGYTTVLVRTQRGNRIYGEALRQGRIEEREFRDRDDVRSTEAEAVDIVMAFAQQKRARGEARRRELGIEGN
jgi:coenzyme F420 hydrogenase subunit beta